jgi:phage gp29-like protein
MDAEKLTQRVPNSTESWWYGLGDDSRSAAALLQTEAAAGRIQTSVYDLFSEMLGKDGHLYAVMQTRLNGLLGLPRAVVASGGENAERSAQSLVEQLVAGMHDFDGLCRALLDGMTKGFAVIECVWGYDAARRLNVVDWIAHRQESFSFGDDGGLELLSPPFAPAPSSQASEASLLLDGRSAFPPQGARPAPARKFLVLKFGADVRHRYGRGLCQHAYWFYWFKKNALKFWAVFTEKFGAPTAVATFPPGTPREERDNILEILRSLQSDAGVVVPETIKLHLLEAGRTGGASAFREFAEWCNDEMSKIVLGGTLTSGEGRRGGSLALGNVHELVRQDYLEADARLLEGVLNNQLVRWMCELNLPGAGIPAIRFDTRPPADLAVQAEVDKTLVGLGVPIPLRYFHERYGRPAPTAGEESLRYDDANLFGYHLQYGILTINEARARLGLGPVPGGERRPRMLAESATPNAGDGAPVDADHGDEGLEKKPEDAAERASESEARGR